MKNSEFVCGIPVPNNYNRKGIYDRFRAHAHVKTHILACAHRAEGGKNEAQTSSPEIEENEELEESVVNYIETRLIPKFPWCQLSEGKLFCKVRNIQGGYV